MGAGSKPYFYSEAAAFAHVEARLWPNGPVCCHCASAARHYRLNGVRTKPSRKNPYGLERFGLYKCSDCRRQFTVRTGTLFEDSHIPLRKWLQAMQLVAGSDEGASAYRLHRMLDISYKSAWNLVHRIREAIRSDLAAMASGEISSMASSRIGCLVDLAETGPRRFKENPLLVLVETTGSEQPPYRPLGQRGVRA